MINILTNSCRRSILCSPAVNSSFIRENVTLLLDMKLYIHQRSFSEELVIINPNDFPDIKVGDFLEIFHPDIDQSHLLVQVKTLSVELPQKGVVSVEQSVASLFQLRAYKTVRVSRVEPGNVALDLVELVFKDQYISRSDMWRLKNSMVNTCIHIQQKVELSGVRAQVQELWSGGEKVSCGAITSDTKVAFRSSTAMVYMFIQMSSEMWDFDTCGDLYMEKAVTGFLTQLFSRWKEKNSNHELNIVLFSRTYFEAQSEDDFPIDMRQRLHTHRDGRFYEDYYRVFVQNERRDDWMPIIAPLKVTMQRYAKDIKEWQKKAGCVCKGQNSNACQGNLLEAINLSLNVFDNHYMNRNFDRTGQLVVLVTPGAGVFEVDRTLCKLTEQRMIDYGIGSDLVCLAEQPLHPVPLLKFIDALNQDVPYKDKYNIPHWLNYSFYFSQSQRRRYFSTQTSYISRLRLPDRLDGESPRLRQQSDPLPRIPSMPHCHNNSTEYTLRNGEDFNHREEDDDDRKFELHDSLLFQSTRRHKAEASNNPFSPATLCVKLTADRRRWTHTFPHGPGGAVAQLHHRQVVDLPSNAPHSRPQPTREAVSQSSSASSLCSVTSTEDLSQLWWSRVDTRRRLGCVWGITGEQVWTPFLQSGMDWKSLTATACFPITTDFYPDRQSLQSDYQEAPYNLSVGEENDVETNVANIKTTFQELISQRLIQDFQMVIVPEQELAGFAARSSTDRPFVSNPSKNEYVLSYGHAFHMLSLNPDMRSIEVVLYTDRKVKTTPKLAYTYSLWPLLKDSYEVTHTRVYHKPVEHNKWNYRDIYISFGGQASREGFELQECVKFWRSRFVLLPSHSVTVRQLADEGYHGNLDIFEIQEVSQKHHLVEGFLRYMEGLNRRRTRLNLLSLPSGSRSQRVSQADGLSSSPALRKASRGSGTSTPTTHNPSFPLTASNISGLLSSIVVSRKEKEDSQPSSNEPSNPASPDKEGRLTMMSGMASIVKAMKEPASGMCFIGGEQRGLPPDSFTSAEAVSWIRRTFEDHPSHNQAVELLQAMLQDGFIHSVFSYKGAKRLVYGFYLYCLPETTQDSLKAKGRYITGEPVYDIPPQQEWFEVACTMSQDSRQMEEDENDGQGLCMLPVYKSIVIEMDNTDLNQVEWCHVSFHGNYQPDNAFDMELQWLTSTPRLLHDLSMNWFRRAQSSGFHLVPSHVDPFSFWEDISDPLCSPVFIPLVFPDDKEDQDLLEQVQGLILSRFGFLANYTSCLSPLMGSASQSSPYSDTHVQYIHVTGAIFALPTPSHAASTSPRPEQLPCLCSSWKGKTSNRGHSGQRSRKRQVPQDPGFLWVNNHLLTKKWRSSACGDEMFRDALFNDFSKLCAREDGRLENIVAMVMGGQQTCAS